MMAFAFTGPMPFSDSSCSWVALLMLTAPMAKPAYARSAASRTRIRFMCRSRFMKAGRLYRRGAPGLDVAAHALLHGEEGLVVAGGAKLREIGLREALVLAHQRGRERHVFD